MRAEAASDARPRAAERAELGRQDAALPVPVADRAREPSARRKRQPRAVPVRLALGRSAPR